LLIKWLKSACPIICPKNLAYVKGFTNGARYTENNRLVVYPFVIYPRISEIKEIIKKLSMTGELYCNFFINSSFLKKVPVLQEPFCRILLYFLETALRSISTGIIVAASIATTNHAFISNGTQLNILPINAPPGTSAALTMRA